MPNDVARNCGSLEVATSLSHYLRWHPRYLWLIVIYDNLRQPGAAVAIPSRPSLRKEEVSSDLRKGSIDNSYVDPSIMIR